jgi:hypothetical protein
MVWLLLFFQILLVGAFVLMLRKVRRVQDEVAEAAKLVDDIPVPEVDPAIVSNGMFITIEILNPLEVASSRMKLAGVAGSVAPTLISKIVYEQSVKVLRRQLDTQGVHAEVKLHGVD